MLEISPHPPSRRSPTRPAGRPPAKHAHAARQDQPDAEPYRAGQEVSVTMMFLDVRNFTGLSRERCPHQVVRTLNRFFELAVPLITDQRGHVDKFMGDGLMASFANMQNAADHADHADRALAAALAIEAAVSERMDGWIKIGIGIDSGTVLAAVVGGGGRHDLTLIGHAVNMAAHVQASTRETGDTILLTNRTRSRLTTDSWLRLRRLRVNGEAEPLTLYAPVTRASYALRASA